MAGVVVITAQARVNDNVMCLGDAIYIPFKLAAALGRQPKGERVAGGQTSQAGEHEMRPAYGHTDKPAALPVHDSFDKAQRQSMIRPKSRPMHQINRPTTTFAILTPRRWI
jgi:hypothetical protein